MPIDGRADDGAPGRVVDAHQHLWDPADGVYDWLAAMPASINRRFAMEDALPHLAATGIDATVLVQAADHDADTDTMLAAYDRWPEVVGVVGYLPLHQPERAATRLAELRGRDGLVGVRNLIHDRPDPDWLLRPDVAEGLSLLESAGLPLDVPAELARHLEIVAGLPERYPELTVVIDHLGKPPVGTDRREPWPELLRRAADGPNVCAKLSGLYPAGGDLLDWDADDLRPWVDLALELFGPDRLLFGSDWPVAVLAGDYERVAGTLRTVIEGYGPDVAGPVLGGTATRVYRLPG